MEHRNAHYSSGRSQLIEYFVVWQWQCATHQKVAEWKIIAVQCGSRKGQHADELPNGSLSNLPPPNVVDLPSSRPFSEKHEYKFDISTSVSRGVLNRKK